MNDTYFNFFTNFKKINKYYNYLIEKTKQATYVGINNEWIIDNFYLLVEHKTNIVHNKKEIRKLIKNTKSLYYCLRQIAVANNYNISFKTLVSELKKYQRNENYDFSYREILAIKYLLIFIYTEKLYLLSEDEKDKLLIKNKVSKIINSCDKNEVTLNEFIDDKFNITENQYYIYEVNSQIKKLGNRSNFIFKEINELLEAKNISLKEIINDFFQERIDNNILISNIFGDLKLLFELNEEELFKNISATEKLLLMDKVYKNMTVDTKMVYREQIVRLAKGKRCSELELLGKLYSISLKEERHIGFYLFKNKNYKLRTILYLVFMCLGTFIISFFLSKYFIGLRALGFLILLIPVSQLLIKIVDVIFSKILPITVMPKINFSNGLDKSATTMVVIPTIISSTEKIKEMFDVLETFYLINKSNNLYFTLLGDVKASSKKDEEYDQELVEAGEKIVSSLNKKYGKELFHFIYRRRVWNESEECYLGYERKRGALVQFNKVLLGKMNDNLSKKNFFVNTLQGKDLGIKYVITLDTDTRLVLSTALNLIGAMAHPLNRPVLNKEKTKVISGYGIMQPRVSSSIEATNKSLYSQIFAGVGGFDTYSAFVPDFYQDFFGEGNFIGKGIYDLECFDKILGDTFPDNLILSHEKVII